MPSRRASAQRVEVRAAAQDARNSRWTYSTDSQPLRGAGPSRGAEAHWEGRRQRVGSRLADAEENLPIRFGPPTHCLLSINAQPPITNPCLIRSTRDNLLTTSIRLNRLLRMPPHCCICSGARRQGAAGHQTRAGDNAVITSPDKPHRTETPAKESASAASAAPLPGDSHFNE